MTTVQNGNSRAIFCPFSGGSNVTSVGALANHVLLQPEIPFSEYAEHDKLPNSNCDVDEKRASLRNIYEWGGRPEEGVWDSVGRWIGWKLDQYTGCYSTH